MNRLTIPQVAELTGYSRSQLYAMAHSGALPAVLNGGRWTVAQSDAEDLAHRRANPAPPRDPRKPYMLRVTVERSAAWEVAAAEWAQRTGHRLRTGQESAVTAWIMSLADEAARK